MTRDELTQYIFDAYSVEPDYPFPKDDVTCVFRHAGNRKWFGIVMRIPYRTIGISREKGCLICSRMHDRLVRYCFTIPYLWGQDPEFRKAFDESKGFCLSHMATILRMSLEALDSKQQKAFSQNMADLQLRNLDRTSKDLVYMIEHYKSENRDKPWNGCEDAQVRAVYKEIGKGRC